MRKRVIPLMLALFMVLSFSPNMIALASPIAPATGNLIIHKLSLEDLSEATASTQGEEATSIPANAEPVAGIAFDVYKITVADNQTVPTGAGATYKLVGGQLQVTVGSVVTTYDIVLQASPGLTDINGELTYSGLARGFYFVVEKLSASTPTINGESVSIGSTVNPFVVAVPMTNPAGDGWLTDVHVYPKNQPITIDKAVNKTSVSIGDEVTYTFTPSVPSDIADSQAYTVTDVLNSALTYKNDSVSITVGGAPFPQSGNYTATYTSGTLVVDFTAAGRQALEGATSVIITFSATVNNGILSNANHIVENYATLNFTNQNGQASNAVSNIVTTHTGQIEIFKTEADELTALPDAKFQIASSSVNAANGNYLKKDSSGNIVDFGETGYDTALTWEELSDANGELSFQGIADYVDGNPVAYNSYWIVETKAPDGFNLLGDPVMVTFDSSANLANSFQIYEKVVNTTEFTLPITGGLGTIVFTIVGIALIGLAVILIISTRKKTSKANES